VLIESLSNGMEDIELGRYESVDIGWPQVGKSNGTLAQLVKQECSKAKLRLVSSVQGSPRPRPARQRGVEPRNHGRPATATAALSRNHVQLMLPQRRINSATPDTSPCALLGHGRRPFGVLGRLRIRMPPRCVGEVHIEDHEGATRGPLDGTRIQFGPQLSIAPRRQPVAEPCSRVSHQPDSALIESVGEIHRIPTLPSRRRGRLISRGFRWWLLEQRKRCEPFKAMINSPTRSIPDSRVHASSRCRGYMVNAALRRVRAVWLRMPPRMCANTGRWVGSRFVTRTHSSSTHSSSTARLDFGFLCCTRGILQVDRCRYCEDALTAQPVGRVHPLALRLQSTLLACRTTGRFQWPSLPDMDWDMTVALIDLLLSLLWNTANVPWREGYLERIQNEASLGDRIGHGGYQGVLQAAGHLEEWPRRLLAAIEELNMRSLDVQLVRFAHCRPKSVLCWHDAGYEKQPREYGVASPAYILVSRELQARSMSMTLRHPGS
jgi:hypothetical protein